VPARERLPGVVVNTRAGSVRRDPGLVARLRYRLPAGALQATDAPEAIEPALRVLHDRGVDTLVVIGGDGSVGGTLTALLSCWPEAELPEVVLTPGGTINTIARSLGAQAPPETLVERLLDGAPPRIRTLRPLVRARSEAGMERIGMIFANGVAVRWLLMYYGHPTRGARAAARVVARIAGSALVRGPLARRLFQPIRGVVQVDGERLDLDRFTVAAASSVRDIGLGFRRVEMRFETAEPWTIDADLFEATRGIELQATRPLRFLVP
jgi:hypothetical protein